MWIWGNKQSVLVKPINCDISIANECKPDENLTPTI